MNAADDDGDVLPRSEADASRISARARISVEFDPPINQVGDPVNRNPGLGVNHEFIALIALETRIRYLDQERNIGRSRMMMGVPFRIAADNGEIRPRLIEVWDVVTAWGSVTLRPALLHCDSSSVSESVHDRADSAYHDRLLFPVRLDRS
jgi:hypothetical protein